MVAGGRALRHKSAVDIDLIVIIGRNIEGCLTTVIRKALAEQNVAITVLGAIQGDLIQLFVKNISGWQTVKFLVCDPLSNKNMFQNIPLLFALFKYV